MCHPTDLLGDLDLLTLPQTALFRSNCCPDDAIRHACNQACR